MSGGTGIGAAAGGGLGLYQSYAQAAAVKKAMGLQWQQTSDQLQGAARSAAEQRAQQVRQAQQLLGRVRVAAGESGNTLDAAGRQVAIDASRNTATINQNLNTQVGAIQSGYTASTTQLRNSVQSPLLAGLLGAVQGALYGTVLGEAFAGPTPPPVPDNSLLGPIWAKYGEAVP